MLNGFRIGVIVGVLGAALALLLRPAPLRRATVTASSAGARPHASVMLEFGFGAPAHSVIIDVISTQGRVGSATVPGTQRFVEVPLEVGATEPYRLQITASYRMLGRLYQQQGEF